MILQYPLRTEKAIKLIELDNTIVFVVDKRSNKQQIKQAVKDAFNVKVKSVNTEIRSNKKIAYIKLAPESLAIDVATKLGLI
jgi:large subunit ribosomal protein L23Ae